jgi:hypothetical protein
MSIKLSAKLESDIQCQGLDKVVQVDQQVLQNRIEFETILSLDNSTDWRP